ncbi:MAG: ABC transporter ATP-binding protein [Erysipelotrichia bacterium]|jgi:ATP-binding cassette subfamily B protein|nr:ABC transporter ATP-binding protein [Erysipelotrichia bacterium]
MNYAMKAKKDAVKDYKLTLKRLLRYLHPYMIFIITGVFFSISATLLNVIGPSVLAQATNLLYDGYQSKLQTPSFIFNTQPVYDVLLRVLIIYGLAASLSYFSSIIINRVTQKITLTLRGEIANKVNLLHLKTIDEKPIGDVLSRITNDVDTINNSLQQALIASIVAILSIVGILFMMFSISWILTLVALVSLPISLFTVSQVVSYGQKYFTQRAKTLGLLNGHIEEMFSNHLIVTAYHGQDFATRKFNELNDELQEQTQKSEFISSLMLPVVGFIGNLGYIAVVLIGAMLMLANQLSLGAIQAFIMYIRNFNQPLNQMANITTIIQSTVAASERVFEFLDYEEEPFEDKAQLPSNIQGEIEFRNVDFGYSADHVFIKNFNMHIKPGMKVAIVGPTGAGKTTIVNLLMRFYDILSGSIYMDKQDVALFTRESIRSSYAMVLQDSWLFKGTIRDNITFNQEVSENDFMKATHAAKVDHFIQTLPLGYDTMINEDASNISSGQKQLITIARAFLSNRNILILDEATSSVDTRTEYLIQEAMEALMSKKTAFIIAHRLSTIINSDLILVMNHGTIVEQGSHKELLASKGFYYDLYQSQYESSTN